MGRSTDFISKVGSDARVTGLVHDYLLVMRGAERTFAEIAACYPDSPIYTLLYDEQRTQGAFGGRVARASLLQGLPVRQKGFRRLLPLLPAATERMELGEHDVVLSSSSAFAHGIRPRSVATHICYCHSPFRYVWHERERALQEVPSFLRPVLSRELDRIQSWDRRAADRVDHFIANSRLTQQRIADFWERDSTIVHPPVDVHRFAVGTPEDFVLIVGELVPTQAGGTSTAGCRASGAAREGRRYRPEPSRGFVPASATRAEFLGRVQDDHLADLMSRAQALVVANVEEFGIAAVESMASGRPSSDRIAAARARPSWTARPASSTRPATSMRSRRCCGRSTSSGSTRRTSGARLCGSRWSCSAIASSPTSIGWPAAHG